MNQENLLALPMGYQLNQYTIDGILGQGGFGIVYKAHHTHLKDAFVVKEFLPSSMASRSGDSVVPHSSSQHDIYKNSYQRFLEEGITLRKLKHPNVVRCTDLFETNGTAYLIMEFEDGLSFHDLLTSLEAAGGNYSEEQLLQVFVPLAEGLNYIHQNGVLHRDIKPGNVFIRRADNSPVLLDFGAAKQNFAEVSQSHAPYTEFYAPIEQTDPTTKAKATIDIHAFGGLMYRAVTGTVGPFANERSMKIAMGQSDPLISAATLAKTKYSDKLLALIDQCLAYRPDLRPQDMKVVLKTLKQLSHGTTTQSPPKQKSQLEELIHLAGSDGIITETEMAYLIKKAIEFGLDQVTAIQQITHESHINGWTLELSNKAESQTIPDEAHPELSVDQQKELLDPLINMAGADGVISESELTHIIEHGIKYSINPNYSRQYVIDCANRHSWTIESEQTGFDRTSTDEVDSIKNENGDYHLSELIEKKQRLTIEQTKHLLDCLIKELRSKKPIDFEKLNINHNNVWISENFQTAGFYSKAFLDAAPKDCIDEMDLYSFAPEFFLGQKIEQSAAVYSLASIAYFCLTGQEYFTDQRLEDDNYQSLTEFGEHHFTQAIDWGMNLKKSKRPSSINLWVKSWTHGVPISPAEEKKSSDTTNESVSPKPKEEIQSKLNEQAKKHQFRPTGAKSPEPIKPEPKQVKQANFADKLIDSIYSTSLFFIIFGSLWTLVNWVLEEYSEVFLAQQTNEYILIGLAVFSFICYFGATEDDTGTFLVNDEETSLSKLDPKLKMNYQHTFLDYVDTCFEFLTGLLLSAVFYGIGLLIILWIIDANTQIKPAAEYGQFILIGLGIMAIWRSIPEERRKNGLLKKEDKYAEISGFFGILFLVVIALVIIGALFGD